MTTDSFEPEWSSYQVLSSQYTTSVVKDGFLYGVHGRQDLGQAEIRCLNPRTQKVIWSNQLQAYGTLILADDKLLITMIDGSLSVAEANPRQYKLLKQAKIQQATDGGQGGSDAGVIGYFEFLIQGYVEVDPEKGLLAGHLQLIDTQFAQHDVVALQ